MVGLQAREGLLELLHRHVGAAAMRTYLGHQKGIYPPDRTPKRRVLSVDDGARPMVGARG
jgi:hypothetical protein